MLKRCREPGHTLTIPRALADRRSVAAMEFALVVPLLITMALAVFDLGRAVVIWEEINNAAEAIAEAAEKLSVSQTPGPSPTLTSMLNRVQIQAAMSTIYVEILGLDYGNGDGNFPGKFAVTLSSIVFLPWCASATGCPTQPTQEPFTLWSANLAEGGPQLQTTSSPPLSPSLLRACSTPPVRVLVPVTQFPDNDQQLVDMIDPAKFSKSTIPVAPQVVADVQYAFTPLVFLGAKTFTLWASATLPAPVNGVTQAVEFDPGAGTANVVQCTGIPDPPAGP